jgi:anaerobic magnesium-protoporphyrin IX monomethyl ester cyclase
MKILFVERIVEYIDPMHIELLSALAKREGCATFLSILQEDDLEIELKRIKPDIVAFSTKTGEHTHYLKAAEAVKKYSPDILTVLGGPHCTFFPGIIEKDQIDVVGSGECDLAWPELLGAYASNGNINSIKNIFTKENWFSRFKDNANLRTAHLAGRTQNLDALPFFDREIVYNRTHLKDFPMRSFMSSRGCPYECTYCFEPKTNIINAGLGPIHIRYSVKRLCAELKEMKERWPTQFVKFYDDMFFIKRTIDPWLEEFAEVYPKEVGLPFFCLTRCNVLTEEILLLLKRAGLHSLTMSIEAGNDYIRDKIIKRHMTKDEILKAFALCEKHKIVTFANSILGIPVKPEIMAEQGKTAIDYDIESLDLNIKCKVTFGEFGTVYPYPGCELTEYVVENGWFDASNFDQLQTSYQSESPLSCFTEKEKLKQNNLSLLGTVCLAFPWTRNLVVNHFIKWRLSRLYFIFYYLAKGYLNIFKVYPMSFSFGNLIRNIIRSFRTEIKKHSPGRRLYQKPKIKDTTTTQMLGGSPKI